MPRNTASVTHSPLTDVRATEVTLYQPLPASYQCCNILWQPYPSCPCLSQPHSASLNIIQPLHSDLILPHFRMLSCVSLVYWTKAQTKPCIILIGQLWFQRRGNWGMYENVEWKREKEEKWVSEGDTMKGRREEREGGGKGGKREW